MATVLLVDDDVWLLGSLGLLIAAEGHVVRTATSGDDALRLALEGRPDIVVTDCAMPGMNGVPLVRELRQHPQLASIPVILISDRGRRPHVKVSGFLRKPFPLSALLRHVHRLDRRPSLRGAEALRGRLGNVLMSAAMRVRVRRAR
jgi:DNA-binding response OmpR family regulator